MTERPKRYGAATRRTPSKRLSAKTAAAKPQRRAEPTLAEINAELNALDWQPPLRRVVRKKILPALIDMVLDPAFGEALEASGELDAIRGTESRESPRQPGVSAEDVKE